LADKLNIAVLGAGSWGSALALALTRNDHRVSLWAHSPNHVKAMQRDNANERYLSGFDFPSNLIVNANLESLVKSHSVFLIATPSHAFRGIVQQLKQYGIKPDSTIIWATKGFDYGNEQIGPVLLSNVIEQELGASFNKAIISGPSFSKEVAANLPTAITCASDKPATANFVAQLFHNQRMRIYTNDDLIGVQVGGSIKNVMAIAAGISDGLGFGANSRSAIITRGLTEISRLGIALGAKQSTFQGLAAMGDLVLTCTDNQSRNRRFGLGLGQGQTVDQTLKTIDQEVEGYITTREVMRLAEHINVDMPISKQVYNVLYENVSPNDAVNWLLKRSLSRE